MFVGQVFCMLLFCLDDYWFMSLFTLVMLVFIESTVVNQVEYARKFSGFWMLFSKGSLSFFLLPASS